MTCGKNFLPSTLHQTSCSRGCSREYRLGCRRERERERREARRVSTIRFCPKCGDGFYGGANKIFCSIECSRTKIVFPPKECAICGNRFTPKNKFGKFCSKRCGRKAGSPAGKRRRYGMKMYRKRARLAGAEYEPVDPIKLFERDGWKCQICGIKTPRSLRGSYEDRAPEVDHRLALASGGSHTWDNVQCACRACNMKKGSRMVLGQLRLFNQPISLT